MKRPQKTEFTVKEQFVSKNTDERKKLLDKIVEAYICLKLRGGE